MNFRSTSLPIALFTLVLAIAGCDRTASTPITGTAPTTPATNLRIVPGPVLSGSESSGRRAAVQSVEIHPRVAGTIDRVGFVDGIRVTRGQVLFRIDPRPFRAEAERQLAARRRALSEIDLARANRAAAQRRVGAGAISSEDLASLASADSIAAGDLAAANAALSVAKLNLELTEIRTPIDGRVSRALMTQGDLVSSDSLLATVVTDPVYMALADDHALKLDSR